MVTVGFWSVYPEPSSVIVIEVTTPETTVAVAVAVTPDVGAAIATVTPEV